jgi:hypothetical protein
MPRPPVAFEFLGCRQAGAGREAAVQITNRTRWTLVWDAQLEASLSRFEMGRMIFPGSRTLRRSILVRSHSTGTVAVPVPEGEGRVHIGLNTRVYRRRPLLLRWGAPLLDRIGVHLRAHWADHKVRLTFGGGIRDDLWDELVYDSFTNGWWVPQ